MSKNEALQEGLKPGMHTAYLANASFQQIETINRMS